MKKLKQVFLHILIFLVCFAIYNCILQTKVTHATAEETMKKNFTLMIYMCGSNLESGGNGALGGNATKDIQEILQSGVDIDNCNILILAGGSTKWDDTTLNKNEIGIYQIVKKSNDHSLKIKLIPSVSFSSMGDSSTLGNFLSFCYEKYPANNYALILWDHGGGPMEGVCFDETQNMDCLSLSEIKEALATSLQEHSLSWVGIDACLMASLETANVFSPYADYLIASQETEPAYGWDYSFLGTITNETSSNEIAKSVVDRYINQNDNNMLLTLSCINLSMVDNMTDAMGKMFAALEKKLSKNNFTLLSNERRNSKSFGRATTLSDYDLADLYHLSQQYELIVPMEAHSLQIAIKEAVYSNSNQINANGISIYSPCYNKTKFTEKWQSEYNSLGISSSYSKYINEYSKIWLGEQLCDWSKLTYQAMPIKETQDTQIVELEMTEEQAEHFASAKVVILQQMGNEKYYKKIFESDEIKTENQKLNYEYDFTMLYAINDRGEKLTDSLPFEVVDGYYFLTPVLENMTGGEYLNHRLETEKKANEEGLPPSWVQFLTILRCDRTDNSNELGIKSIGLVDYDQNKDLEDDELFRSREFKLTDLNTDLFPYLDFNEISIMRKHPSSEENILPFSKWTGSTYSQNLQYVNEYGETLDTTDFLLSSLNEIHEIGIVDLRNSWKLQFEKSKQSERNNLYAQFIIIDSQGNEIASELIRLNEENIISSGKLNETIYDDENKDMTFMLDSIEAIKTNNGSLLRFSLTGIFPLEKTMMPVINSIEINNRKIDSFSNLRSKVKELDIYDGNNIRRSYTFDVNFLNLPSIEDLKISSVRIIGDIYDYNRNPDSQIIGSTNKLFSFDKTFDIQMDLSKIWNVRGWYSHNSINYRITSIRIINDKEIEGTMIIENTDIFGSHTLSWNNDETNFPGVCLNDYYIENAWEGPSVIEVPSNSEVGIDFKIHLPDTNLELNNDPNVSFLNTWNIRSIQTLTLFIHDDLNKYSWSDGNTYHVFTPGYERIDIHLNPDISILGTAFAPKEIMIGENMEVLISSIHKGEKTILLNLMVKNDNAYYTDLDCKMYDLTNKYVYYRLSSCKLDDSPMIMRLALNSDHEGLEWGDYVELEGTAPHAYKYFTVELAREDGYDIPSLCHEITMNVGFAVTGDAMYTNASNCLINIEETTQMPFVAANDLSVIPSIILAKIDFSFPSDQDQYMTKLLIQLPEQIEKRYEEDDVEMTNVFLISPSFEESGNQTYHRIYAAIDDGIRQKGGTLSIPYSGLLVCPEGYATPLLADIIHDYKYIKTNLPSFRINSYSLHDHLIDYDYTEMEVYSSRDREDDSSWMNKVQGSVSVSTVNREPTIDIDGAVFVLEHSPDGSIEISDLLYDTNSYLYEYNRPGFKYVPTSEFSPLVLVAISYADGTSSYIISPFNDVSDNSDNRSWFCKICEIYTRGETCSRCGDRKSGWICEQCGRKNSAILPITECKGCGIKRSESFIMTANKYLENGEYTKAIPFLDAAANDGNAYAIDLLDSIYSEDQGADKDI